MKYPLCIIPTLQRRKKREVAHKPQESLISVLGRETWLTSRYVYFIPKERDYRSSRSACKKTDVV